MDDLVSIITPAYNAEKYIKQAIESVISQTYKNWELIIVNDFSNDNTRLIIEQYSKKDERIKLINQEANKGIAITRNTALKYARGRYVAFLDSDDLWKEDKLLKQIKFMNNNNSYFTFTKYELINETGEKLNKTFKIPQTLEYKNLLNLNSIGCLTVVIDRKKIKKIHFPLVNHEDYATWLNILKEGFNAHGIDEVLACYRKGDTSISSNKLKTLGWTWKIYRNNQNLNILLSIKSMSLFTINTLIKYINR